MAPSHHLNQCYHIVNWTNRNKLQWNVNRNSHIITEGNAFVSVVCDLANIVSPWWRHLMETFSTLLTYCAGNSPVTGEFPAQRPVTWSFAVFFDRRLNQQLSKQWRRRWFETPSRSLWSHCYVGLNVLIRWSSSRWSVNLSIWRDPVIFCHLQTWRCHNPVLYMRDRHLRYFNSLRPRQMDTISQMTFSDAFSWMKMFEFRLKFHWNLFPGVQLTIFQQ